MHVLCATRRNAESRWGMLYHLQGWENALQGRHTAGPFAVPCISAGAAATHGVASICSRVRSLAVL